MFINEKEFANLIDQYTNLIFSVCLNITNDYFDSEDLTQETFLAAYRNIHTFKGGNLKAWLCKIAVNKCRDHLRKYKHKYDKTLPQDKVLKDVSVLPMEERIAQKETYHYITDVIDNLREPYHSVAHHYYILNLPLSDFAKQKKIPIKTAQTQIRRAKKIIRDRCKEVCKDDSI